MQYSQHEIDDCTRDVLWQIEHDTGITGRINPKMTRQVAQVAVASWPPLVPTPRPTVGHDAHRAAARVIRERVRARYEERYGMGIIASILLSAVIQAVVAAILKRWWNRDTEFRRQLRTAQYGAMRHES